MNSFSAFSAVCLDTGAEKSAFFTAPPLTVSFQWASSPGREKTGFFFGEAFRFEALQETNGLSSLHTDDFGHQADGKEFVGLAQEFADLFGWIACDELIGFDSHGRHRFAR